MIVGHIGGGSVGGYQVQRSVRLRSAASAYFSRTPGSASNRTTYTWSGWVKRGALGSSSQEIFSAGTSSPNYDALRFAGGNLQFYTQGASANNANVVSTAEYRDPSAWYHIVVAVDSTQATAANRVKLYINGSQITALSTAQYMNQNNTGAINSTVAHYHGAVNVGGFGNFLDGYLTEINFIDGQALTPTSFAEQDTATRMWVPKKYAGTYGTNGFYLDFSDITSTTTLGNDKSGNGNNWTANNISLTSGVTYDSMLDVPGLPWADGGNGRGNYATLNPLDKGASYTLAGGNLNASSSVDNQLARGTVFVSSGKWYAESTCTGLSSGQIVGIAKIAAPLTNYLGSDSSGYGYASGGNKITGGSGVAYGATWGLNDVIGIALDLDAGTLTFYKNGVSQGTAFSGLSGEFSFAHSTGASSSVAFNFGQRPFAYTPPTGFKALNTANLPDPTGAAAKPWEHFDVLTHVGTGSARSVSGAAFTPDLVWIKARSTAFSHKLYDSVRGVYKELNSDATAAESSDVNQLTAFNSGGFSVGTGLGVNQNTSTFVDWLWKAGGAAVSNTAGSITSQVSANTAAGVSVVTYTGNGTNPGATIGHGLSVAPAMIITKSRSGTGEWPSYHKSVGVTNTVYLNATYASGTYLNRFSSVSSTTFTTGASGSELNTNAVNYVAYCFAEIAGFSRFGSYTGNGSSDGPFIYTGGAGGYLMVKRTDTAGFAWVVWDSARNSYNESQSVLFANTADAETSPYGLDFLSNGCKFRGSGASFNASGGTYIYAWFARNPFKYANAR